MEGANEQIPAAPKVLNYGRARRGVSVGRTVGAVLLGLGACVSAGLAVVCFMFAVTLNEATGCWGLTFVSLTAAFLLMCAAARMGASGLPRDVIEVRRREKVE